MIMIFFSWTVTVTSSWFTSSS